jgi:hypothetical protein
MDTGVDSVVAEACAATLRQERNDVVVCTLNGHAQAISDEVLECFVDWLLPSLLRPIYEHCVTGILEQLAQVSVCMLRCVLLDLFDLLQIRERQLERRVLLLVRNRWLTPVRVKLRQRFALRQLVNDEYQSTAACIMAPDQRRSSWPTECTCVCARTPMHPHCIIATLDRVRALSRSQHIAQLVALRARREHDLLKRCLIRWRRGVRAFNDATAHAYTPVVKLPRLNRCVR